MGDDTSPGGSKPEQKPLGEAAAWTVLSYLISGPLVYGGIGWLADRWLGTGVFVAIGIVVGMGLSLYIIVMRYVVPSPQARPERNTDSDQGG
jgi:F0F1-type ATP synthase assembly protein I